MDALDIELNLQSSNNEIIAETLAFIGLRNDMRDLSVTIGFIRHEDSLVKRAAINATVAIIRHSLVENYNTLGPEGRKKLAEIIDLIHPETVLELLREAHSNNEQIRIHSLMILGLLRRRESIRTVIEKDLKSNNVRVRATATQAIGNHRDAGEHLMLLKQLNDSDCRVRANAVEALEQYGDQKVVFSLKRLLNDGNSRVRANALKALYHFGFESIENDIIAMLTDRSLNMVASGLWLVGVLGINSETVFEHCKAYQYHPDPMIKRNYERAREIMRW